MASLVSPYGLSGALAVVSLIVGRSGTLWIAQVEETSL